MSNAVTLEYRAPTIGSQLSTSLTSMGTINQEPLSLKNSKAAVEAEAIFDYLTTNIEEVNIKERERLVVLKKGK